ncbi:MAG TPA: RelA/SpoT domain-containing protein [Dongiaceae bacterium]|nr:RelA/SpoT domain-containing protein [Dongiaceae bacterium]
MAFFPPEYSPNRVRNSGKSIAAGKASEEDWAVLNNWRNSHAYVLNTFQNNLRRHIGARPVTLAQRLKRKNTIIDKLTSGRAKDLSTMHDLAGCRLIFETIDDLEGFRKIVHRSRARHKYVSDGRYDYLSNPKPTGYRGRHDVFTYQVDSSEGELYNGLRIEIQYRTRVQHAWATAVEISDFIERTRVKFDRGADPRRERLFVLASEFLARCFEQRTGPLPELTNNHLIGELSALEDDMRILHRLAVLDMERTDIPRGKNVVLHFSQDRLVAETFRSTRGALHRRDQIEFHNPEDDVVYVRASKPGEVATAFRNYFKDTKDFVEMMRESGISL